MYVVVVFFVFFKQKTAYEMRISDWSSDVCSSDLRHYTPFRADLKAAKSQTKDSGSFDSTGVTTVSPSPLRSTSSGPASPLSTGAGADSRPAWLNIDRSKSSRFLARPSTSSIRDRKSTRLNSSH